MVSRVPSSSGMNDQVQEWTPSVLLSLGAQAMSGPINSIFPKGEAS